jgi:peptidoglycan/xylan/chitin deacetylase (PgdA/CDA1 family)
MVVQSVTGDRPPQDRWNAASCERQESAAFYWMSCTTRGNGNPALLANPAPYDPPLDLTGKLVKARVKTDDLSRLGGIELRLTSDDFRSSYFAFSVPLFSDGDFNLLRDGVWTTLTFSLGSARIVGAPDRTAIDGVGLYFADSGKAPVRVAWAGLSAVDHPSEGCLSFTFDDGTRSHWEIAAPEMARFGFRGTAYVMPDQIGQTEYLTLDEIRELRDRYGWDVAAHHAIPFTEFAPAELEPTILGIQRYLRKQGFEKGAAHLAYPLGRQDPEVVRPLVRKHFATARLAGAGPETIPPADPHLLRAVNVLDTTTAEELGEIARRARDHGEWAILMFHHLRESTASPLDYSIERFRQALERIDESGVRVLPVSEVWELAREREAVTAPVSAEN